MARNGALKAIRFYQRRVSPLFGPRCRYYPTCSQYAYDAVERYGVLIGGVLGALRLLRCNPLFPGGVDPVPELGQRYKRNGRRLSGATDEKTESRMDSEEL